MTAKCQKKVIDIVWVINWKVYPSVFGRVDTMEESTVEGNKKKKNGQIAMKVWFDKCEVLENGDKELGKSVKSSMIV